MEQRREKQKEKKCAKAKQGSDNEKTPIWQAIAQIFLSRWATLWWDRLRRQVAVKKAVRDDIIRSGVIKSYKSTTSRVPLQVCLWMP